MQQMLSNAKFKTRRRVRGDEIAELGLRDRCCLAIHFLSIFPILTATELSVLFKNGFGKSDYREERNIISLLYSASYVRRVPDNDK